MSELAFHCEAWEIRPGQSNRVLDECAVYPGTWTLEQVRESLLKNLKQVSQETGAEILIVITRAPMA